MSVKKRTIPIALLLCAMFLMACTAVTSTSVTDMTDDTTNGTVTEGTTVGSSSPTDTDGSSSPTDTEGTTVGTTEDTGSPSTTVDPTSETDVTTQTTTESPTETQTDTTDTDETTSETTVETDTDTGMCEPLSCFDAMGYLVPPLNGDPGYAFEPDCQDGLQTGELAQIMAANLQNQYPWMDDCFADNTQDYWSLAEWMFPLVQEDFDPDEEATDCLLEKLLFYQGGVILAPEPNQSGGTFSWGQQNKVLSRYCFSGANTSLPNTHIVLLTVVNQPGLNEQQPGPYLKSTEAICDGGDPVPVVFEGGLALETVVKCHTANGVAGQVRLEIDLYDNGGMPGVDQLRLIIPQAQTADDDFVHIAGNQEAVPVWTLN